MAALLPSSDFDELFAGLAPDGAWDDGETALLAFEGGAGVAPPDAGVTPLQLRCLDGSHAPGCVACCAPPEEHAQGEYELVGDAGKRNGEKKVRLTHV